MPCPSLQLSQNYFIGKELDLFKITVWHHQLQSQHLYLVFQLLDQNRNLLDPVFCCSKSTPNEIKILLNDNTDANLAVNLALVLVAERAVQPLVADVTLEAGLVPFVSARDLLLSSKHGLGAGRTSTYIVKKYQN